MTNIFNEEEKPLVEVATEEDVASEQPTEHEPTPEEVLAQLAERERLATFGRTLSVVKKLVPEEQDPTVLFRNNWLAQGQAAALVSSTGLGKSSMAMQCALNWTLGKDFLAQPMRPLKIAIIQAEDSERDMAEQLDGMRKGMTTLDDWTDEEFDKAVGSILYPSCFLGLQGDAFIAKLREFQAATKCDMLFINPVQAFFGGDISNQADVSHWARAGIDPILKDPNHPCAAFLVMHTAKIVSGDDKGRANVNDYGEYIGAGSHEWIDWLRAQFVFLKHKKSEDYVDFRAAKRGARLRWGKGGGFVAKSDLDSQRTTTKVFMRSDGFIYWQEITDTSELDAIDGKIPEEDNDITAMKIAEDIKEFGPCRVNDFEQRFRNVASRSGVRSAKRLILLRPDKYRINVKPILIGRNWVKYIGRAKDIAIIAGRERTALEQSERLREMREEEQRLTSIREQLIEAQSKAAQTPAQPPQEDLEDENIDLPF